MTVGEVAFDLQIKDTLAQQLERIARNAKAPAERVGAAIGEMIGEALEQVKMPEVKLPEMKPEISFDDSEIFKDIDTLAREAAGRYEETIRKTAGSIAPPEISAGDTGSVTVTPALDLSAARAKIDELSEYIRSRLGSIDLDVSDGSLFRVKENADKCSEALGLMQKRWQETAAIDPEQLNNRLASSLFYIRKMDEYVLSLKKGFAGLSEIDPFRDMLAPEKTEKPLKDTEEHSRSAAGHIKDYFANVLNELKLLIDSVLKPIGGIRPIVNIISKAIGKISELAGRLAPIAEKVAGAVKSIAPYISKILGPLKYALNVVSRLLSLISALTAPFRLIKTAAAKAFSAVKNVGTKAFSSLKKIGSRALSAIGSKMAGLRKSALSVMTPVKKLGTALKNTFKRVFLLAGAYAAFRALKDGLLEAANADEQFSDSLNAVKANLTIAFAPILQQIMPMLNTLMLGLAAVTKQIAGFIAGVFGTTYAQAASAAKKLKGVTDAAKKAKLAAAGIDELNILSDSSDDEKDSTGIDYGKLDMSEPELPDWAERLKNSIRSGDWQGVGAILAERVNSAFEGIDLEGIEQKAAGAAEKVCAGINGFFLNLDFPAIGEALAGGINTVTGVINTIADKIKWEDISRKATKGLNTAVAKIKWNQLGRALSAKIRILTDILYGFVTEFDWGGLGAGIGEAVNGWFDGIDFAKLGATLSEGIKGIFTAVTALLQTIDFGSIGEKLAQFFGSIDIAGIISGFAAAVSALVSGALDLAVGFIEGMDWQSFGDGIFNGLTGSVGAVDWGEIIVKAFELLGAAVGAASALAVSLFKGVFKLLESAFNKIKGYFRKKIEEHGGNIIAGVFDGIISGISSVGRWIKEHIFEPFIKGFKKAFGIASPSKETAILGGYIIDGLLGAISDGIEKVRSIFKELLSAVKKVFEGVEQWFGDKFRGAMDNITSAFTGIGAWFTDRYNDVKSAFSAVGTWFGDRFTGAWDNIKAAFSGVKSFFGGVWDGITGVFGKVTDWFREKFSAAWQAVKDVFSSGGEIFHGIVDSISNVFKNVVNSLIDGINWVIAQPFNAINDALGALRDWELWTPWGDFYPFDWLPEVSVPEIPHLAKGGLATAPTLAMVGDNRNARTDPEAIAPISKLKELTGSDNTEVVELLRIIVELLRSGLTAELIGSLFGSDLKRAVLKICAEDKARRGE